MNKKASSVSLTILICTANRGCIFFDTIESISSLCLNIPIVVVDNNLNGLSKILKEKVSSFANLIIITEPNPGLSHARNAGVKEVDSEWILFLDDDIKLPPCFFEKLEIILNEDKFDCFGGMYYPFYPLGRPRWLSDSFGMKTPLRSDSGLIDIRNGGFLAAGIMAVRKRAIESVGGFSPRFGMTDNIGYGEEDDLQIRLQAAGYKIGFVPDWWLYHAVLPHKHKVSWHLKSAYARGRDGQRVHNKWTKGSAFFYLVKGGIGVLVRSVSSVLKLIFQRDYYWQNAIIDTIGPFLNIIGRWLEAMKQ